MKKLIPAIIAVAIIGAISAFALMRPDESQTNSNQQTSSDMSNMDMNNDTRNKPEESKTAQETNTVEISDFAFSPATIRVKKGTTVTWTNRDDAGHDITPTSGADDFKASELLSKDESYSFTFNTVGSYEYKCSPHPYMKGVVEVVE